MGTTGDERPPMRALDDPPEFELHHHIDDSGDPVEVTVYPGDRNGKLAEQWLTIEIGHVLSLEEIR